MDFGKVLEITYNVLLTASIGCLLKLISNQHKNKKIQSQKSEEIITKLDSIERKVDDNEMKSSRYRIIRFDDEENNGVNHSSDHWEQIIDDIDIYKTYCNEHEHFINHKGQNAMERILKAYGRRN